MSGKPGQHSNLPIKVPGQYSAEFIKQLDGRLLAGWRAIGYGRWMEGGCDHGCCNDPETVAY